MPSPTATVSGELSMGLGNRSLDSGFVAVAETTGSGIELRESDIVREAQNGSGEAFERLYRKHGRRVYALCLRMVSDPDRAEDLPQAV